MEKILLCGNGININFNEKFKLDIFIEIFKNEEKLKDEIDKITSFSPYQKWKDFSTNFINIVKRCNKNLINLSEDIKNNGVEESIFIFLESVDILMRIKNIKISRDFYNKFKEFFKILFFNYIHKLEIEHLNIIKNMPIINGFIKKLMQYISIYTLNYDSILENILFPKFIDLQEIYHLHGKMIYNNEIKTLHFDNCLIEEYEFAKKSNLPIIPIAIDKDLEQKLELDILGLNPINDENIIALFINSKSFKSINFYYHTKNDIKNLKKILEQIKNKFICFNQDENKFFLKESNDYPTFKYEINNEYKKIILYYFESECTNLVKYKVDINLIKSEYFWLECEYFIDNQDIIYDNFITDIDDEINLNDF